MNLITMIVSEYNKILSNEETYDLFIKYRNGDKEAYKKIIYSNIKLVLNQVNNKFNTVEYDKEELISIGLVGLIKGVQTFNIEKNYKFSTYAIRCIDNEILLFLRKLTKIKKIDSLDRVLYEDEDKIRLMDVVSDKTDCIESLINNNTLNEIIIVLLDEKEQLIIKLYFGFYNNKLCNQTEIAKVTGYSQPQISKIIKKILYKIKNKLVIEGLIEVNTENKKKQLLK